MEDTGKVFEELALMGVLELPGEPAVVINGLPPLPPPEIQSDGGPVSSSNTSDAPEKQKYAGFGEWVVGREVKKLFGEQFYSGKVRAFDKETGWYKVVYEDGDSEEVEWNELKEILEPIDIMVTLKTLATRIVRKKHNTPLPKSRKSKARGKNDSSGGNANANAKGKGKGKRKLT